METIIALDFPNREETLKFLDKFNNLPWKPYVKIGMELFYSEGPEIINEIKRRGHKIFLDLKLHDIPNTVKKAMKSLSNLDVDMVNVHTAGGIKMMREAMEGLTKEDGTRPVIIGVTQLTSTSAEMLEKELLISTPMEETISQYARNAKEAGLDGVVCSPLEIEAVKKACGNDFITVTPGIRFADSKQDDQVRIMTPDKARALGTEYIVVGRPITQAADPVAAYLSTRNLSEEVASQLLKIKAVFLRPEEPFTWASGIKSPIYCDNRLILSDPEARSLVENAIAVTVGKYYPEAEVLMGTSTAGIAHAAIAAQIMGLPMGYVRGSAKDHGRNNKIEGRLEKGQKVVVIEDLISTGGSCLEVVEALREAGADVLGVVSIFSYGMKKAQDRFREADVEYHSLSNLATLLKVARKEQYITEPQQKEIIIFAKDTLNAEIPD